MSLYIIVLIVIIVLLLLIFLPKILQLIGLHPSYKGNKFNLPGKKALIITTSHDTLLKSKKPTGVYASEMTVPYYEFIDANLDVDLASIKGGKIPIEPLSLKYPIRTHSDKRFLNDKTFNYKVKNSKKIDDINVNEYDIIFLAGGWGAAYDFGQSETLGKLITEANIQNKLIGSVCHGALGLIKAKDENGNPLIQNRTITGVTNKQIKELKITETPLHPETELRNLNANFKSQTKFKDILANLVVEDQNIITGQNQNAGKEVSQKLLSKLTKK